MSDKSMFSLIKSSVKGARRISQTARIVSLTGFNWALGDRPPPAKLLRQTFEQLGTTYIKLGQFIASSPTFFPEEYVLEFQHCLDNTPAIPFKQIKSVIEAELGQPLYKSFIEFNPEPLASASIAQVHSARLHNGDEVVVKVQKPGVHNILLTDFNFLLLSARVLEYFVPNLSIASLSDITEELQKSMLEECDFVREASNIQEFQDFLAETTNQDVVAPKVYPQLSANKVLTMERFHGVAFTDLDSIKRYVEDPQFVLIAAMNTWFASLLLAKSFHADVHAGNLMVLKNGKIGFIDFGIVGRIGPETWSSVAGFMHAITASDFEKMAVSMVGIGVTDTEIDTDALAEDIRKLYATLDNSYTDLKGNLNSRSLEDSLQENDLNKTMVNLVGIGKRYGIHFPREFALLLKQILYFDRYVQLLAPNADFYGDNRLVMLPEIL